MEHCKSCLIYKEDYNEHMQRYDDTGTKEKCYCLNYKSGIPDDIKAGKIECEHYIPKEVTL